MFKLVVLSALFAAAVAEPGLLSPLLAPAPYAATITAPATTSTYVQHSSYIAPTVYSDISYPHFIKKRSPQFLSNYVAPYVAGAPIVTPYASSYVAPAPITYSSSLLSTIAAPAHFIKKRSPQFFGNYVAPYVAGSPLVTPYASTYVAPAPITYSSPLLSTIAEPAHLIKKRSAPLLAAGASYIADASTGWTTPPLAISDAASINPYYPQYYSNYFPSLPLIKK